MLCRQIENSLIDSPTLNNCTLPMLYCFSCNDDRCECVLLAGSSYSITTNSSQEMSDSDVSNSLHALPKTNYTIASACIDCLYRSVKTHIYYGNFKAVSHWSVKLHKGCIRNRPTSWRSIVKRHKHSFPLSSRY